MENRKAKKPLNKAASKSASDDLYAAHEKDPKPNALFSKDGKRKKLDPKKNSQASLRKEWMDNYIANGGKYEEKPDSSASLEKSETTHCPKKRTNWLVLDYHYNDVEGTPVAGMDFCMTCSDGSEINGNLDKNGLCRLDDIPEGNVDIEYGKKDEEDELKSIRAELKATLDKMVNEVAQDSKYLEKELKKRGFLEKQLIHTGAKLKGAYDAAEGILSTGWYVLKKGHELERKLKDKAYRAIRDRSLDEIKDDLGTLQFKLDVTYNKVQNSFEVIQIIKEDPESRDILMNFPRRYLGAMHSTDFDQYIGALAFEVLIAVLTGGGSSAATVAKSRHFGKVRSLVERLLVILKKKRLKKKKFSGQQKTIVEKEVKVFDRIKHRFGKFKRAKPPQKRGMRSRDDKSFSEMAEKGDIILVRNSNPSALEYIGKPGYKAKPLEMKGKTRQGSPNEGLAAVDPNDRRLIKQLKMDGKDYDAYVKEVESGGDFFVGTKEEGYIIKDAAGNKFYSDYDLHGVYDAKTGKDSYSLAKKKELNDNFGAKLIQHDPHDKWAGRNNPDIAGINRGPQPPVTAYLPDGSKYELTTIADMRAFYKKNDIAWDRLYPNDK